MNIFLFVSLFCMFYLIVSKDIPETDTILKILKELGFPLLSAVVFFMVGSLFYMSPVAGFLLAVVGWFLEKNLASYISSQSQKKIRKLTKDFISTATSLYRSGQTTPEVLRKTSAHLGDPLSGKLKDMLVERRSMNTLYSQQFADLAKLYSVKELDAVGRIIAVGEISGGSKSISSGFMRLMDAISLSDKRDIEKYKAYSEPALVATLSVVILIITSVFDMLFYRDYFTQGLGKFLLLVGVTIISGLILFILKLKKY